MHTPGLSTGFLSSASIRQLLLKLEPTNQRLHAAPGAQEVHAFKLLVDADGDGKVRLDDERVVGYRCFHAF